MLFKTKEKTMFIYPTVKGYHVLDAELVVPHAVIPSVVNVTDESESESESELEPEELESLDPFMCAFEEEESYYDDFLDFYCGQHVQDYESSQP